MESLICKYNIDNKQILSEQQLLSIYLFAIKQVEVDGVRLNSETINFYIQSAQEELENYLDLKFNKQIIFEQRDFYRDDWQQWSFIPTTYPVLKAYELGGYINTARQITYPKEWISVKGGNTTLPYRQVHLVPNGSTSEHSSNSVVYNGVLPHLGFSSMDHIPNYWHVVYATGFEEVPKDILNFVGKLASINIFHLLGDLILGAGIASQSIGIDGLSQSISTTSSATNAGYGSRITGYLADLKLSLPRLKSKYKGITMVSM